MTKMTRSRATVFALLLATTAGWTPAPLAHAQTASAGAIAQLVDAPRIDIATIARLHDGAVLGSTLDALRDRFDTLARTASTPERRARARLIEAALYWRSGEEAAASASIDAALALAPDFDAWLMKAELTEIADVVAAVPWYHRALDAAPTQELRQRITLRLALVDAMARPEALVAYAGTAADGATQRIADVLAILGRPDAALRLAGTGAAGDAAAHFRLAGWAAAAGNAATTRAEAWQAYLAARDDGDRRYALALLVEGYRLANDLRGADAFLAAKPADDAIAAARVGVLLESGRTAEAVALVRSARDPELRRRLVGILDIVGDTAASEAEYRRLIAANPDVLDPYVGLAAVYLGRGEEARADGVFRQYLAANRGRPELLAEATRQMVAMGLGGDQPMQRLMVGGAAPGPAMRMFLFRTYLARGDQAQARAELDALVAGNPSDAVLGDAVDGYLALQDPARAFALLRRMEASGRTLDYDRTVQLATLATRTGATDEALTRWLAAWRSATLPARRNFAGQQIVRLATASGRLRALIDADAARLRAGTLGPDAFDLLVTLRLAANDRQGAVADIQTFAARGGVPALQQAARAYARANDYPALDATLRQLETADPTNRADYLRQRILTTVRYGEGSAEDRRRQLDQLTAQLPAQAGTDTAEFRASVYALAGFADAAITDYRRAAAGTPSDGDALLRLADALKKQQRGGEALAMLQFAADSATSTDAVATALDGVLDLVGTGDAGFVTLETSRAEALRWVERRALEQLIRGGDGQRLQGILADTAAALGDAGLQFRVYEAALPAAGGQRAMLLRRLIALASQPPAGSAAAGGQVDDSQRKLRYARRLLPLRRSFPPDFYADIATSMLEAGDLAGTEAAFAMVADAGPLANVDEIRGRAFAAANMPDAAIANLGRALARDAGNFELLIDTSIRREVRGETAIAFRWYWRGLDLLIARQSTGTGDDRGDQGVDIRQYAPTMTEGALLNWPADSTAAATTKALVGRIDADITGIDPAKPGPLADRQQLSSTLDLAHRVDAAGHADAALDAAQMRVARLFAGDPDFVRADDYHKALQGRADPIAPGQADWAIRALVRQAVLTGNNSLAVALAIRTDDIDTIRSVLGDEIRRDAAWSDAIAATGRAAGQPPQAIEVLVQLLTGLPKDRIASAVAPLIDAAPRRETLVFDLYRQSPAAFAAYTTAIGRAPIPVDRLIELMVTRGNDPLGGSGRVGAAWGSDWSLKDFTVAQQLDLLDRLVTRIELGTPAPPLTTSAIQSLLAMPLDPAAQARLKAILLRDVVVVRNPARRSIAPLLAHLLQFRIAAANRALLIEVADAATRRYPDAAALPAALRAGFSGDGATAGKLLDALEAGLATQIPGANPIVAARAALAPAPAPVASSASTGAAPPRAAPAPPAPPPIGEAAKGLVRAMIAAQRTAPATVPAVLRDTWRRTPIDLWQRRSLAQGMVRAAETGPDRVAWSAIIGRPDVVAELLRYPSAMDPVMRHGTQVLYELIARGVIAGGGSDARMAALLGQLRAGTIDADAVQLLVTLAAQTGATLPADATALLAERLRRTPTLAVDERVRAAEVFARAGDTATAGDLLSAALAQTMYPRTPLDNAADAGDIIASLRRWSDRAEAERAYAALATSAGAETPKLPPLSGPME